MNQGAGDRLSQEYFRLIEEILKSRGLSGRELSRRIERSEGYFSRVKSRGDVAKTWRMVEEGLKVSPRTLFAVLANDVQYDQILVAFGPQDEPQKPEFLAALAQLEDLVLTSPMCRRGDLQDGTWRKLEELERRRFKDAEQVEAECSALVQQAAAKTDLGRTEAIVAVGALGVWSTIRRHANDRGSATQGLSLAIRVSFVLGAEKLSARLLQRAVYLLLDVEKFRSAELMLDRAFDFYLDIGDSEGMGMVLIDTGFSAFAARDLDRAESRVLLGVELLGTSPLHHVSKASAFQLAAKACSIQGDLEKSSQYLEQAAKYAVSHDHQWAAIRWCAGNLLFQLTRLEEAEAALREALQIYIRRDKVTDIVMILLDWAAVLTAAGKQDEIPALASHLDPYLNRLSEKSQVRHYVEEAHACLVRSRHLQALERFRKEYEQAWRGDLATQ